MNCKFDSHISQCQLQDTCGGPLDQFLFFAHIFKLTIKAPKLVQKCPKMIEIAIITLDVG